MLLPNTSFTKHKLRILRRSQKKKKKPLCDKLNVLRGCTECLLQSARPCPQVQVSILLLCSAQEGEGSGKRKAEDDEEMATKRAKKYVISDEEDDEEDDE